MLCTLEITDDPVTKDCITSFERSVNTPYVVIHHHTFTALHKGRETQLNFQLMKKFCSNNRNV